MTFAAGVLFGWFTFVVIGLVLVRGGIAAAQRGPPRRRHITPQE